MRLFSFLLGFELNTSYHAQPTRSRRQLYKLLQTAALSTLILARASSHLALADAFLS